MESTNEIKKLSFFRRIKIALIDLEDYILFLPENFSKSVFFMFKLAFALSIILCIASAANLFIKYGSFENCIQSTVPEFTYNNGALKIEDDSKMSSEEKVILDNVIQVVAYNEETYSKEDLVKQIRELPKTSYIFGVIFYLIFNVFDIVIYWFLMAFLIIMLEYLLLLFSRIRMKFRKDVRSCNICINTFCNTYNNIFYVKSVLFSIY